jgi:LmbE family N-acetylglucosaminyl deacetylase
MTYPSGLKPFIHSYEISVQNPINILIDITEQMPEKVKAMQIYASQNEENNYPDLVTALNRSRTLTLPPDVKYSEGFFQYSEKDLQISLRDMTHHIINLYQ